MATLHSNENHMAIDLSRLINTVKSSLHALINKVCKDECIDMIGFSMPDGAFMLHPTIADKVRSFDKDTMITDEIVENIAKQIVEDLIINHIEG